jgi:hypothetical protein
MGTNDTKQIEKEAAKKAANKGCTILFILAAIITLTVYLCSGGGDDVNANMTYPADSLLVFFAENTNLIKDSRSVEVVEFNKHYCRIRVTIPEEEGRIAADMAGKGACILTVQWLAKRGFQFKDPRKLESGISVSCYVYSPGGKGATGKDLTITWGTARYNPLIDNAEWEWAKDNKFLQ